MSIVANPSTATAVGELPTKLTDRLRALRESLLTGLVERDVTVRLALIAALAGEHLLLIGPPGTAKSLIARRLQLAFEGATYFERLLTRFTVPEELFGPLSIKGLEDDRYERLTACYLPKASIAFLDEIFKANSAILNSLLTLLNEREFDNGVQREPTPLIAVIGASNELPETEELDALFDRFLLRLHVGPVSKGAFSQLLALRGQTKPTINSQIKLSPDDLALFRAEAEKVAVPDDVVALLCELREWCAAESLTVSDRRWRKVVKLLQTSAYTNGRDAVSVWDCWLLQHCLWSAPEERKKVYEWYASRVGSSAAMDPSRLTRIVAAWEGRLKRDGGSRTQVRSSDGELLYKKEDGKPTLRSEVRGQKMQRDEPLFLAPAECWTQPYNSQNSQVYDRTNAGSGYTRQELDLLYTGNRVQIARWSGKNAYITDRNNWLIEDYKLPPMMEPSRHRPVYIEACVEELERDLIDVQRYDDDLQKHLQSLQAEIHNHLWVTPEFAAPASENLQRTVSSVAELLLRLGAVRDGFRLLPVDDGSPGPVVETEPDKSIAIDDDEGDIYGCP